MLPSEDGVWAEGISDLSLWAQGDSSSWPPVPGADVVLPPGAYPELAETAPWKNGQSDATFLQDVEAFAEARGFRGKEWGQSSKAPHPRARAVGI